MPEMWPTVADVQARLGVPAVDPADTTDLQKALDAAVDYTMQHSTVYATSGPTSERLRRGVVDLAVALYERRGVSQDPFDGISPAMWLSFNRLLGIGRHALPTVR